MQNFSELTLSPSLKDRLLAARFTTPTPVQAAAIPHSLGGKDVLATAQTGTGSSVLLTSDWGNQTAPIQQPGDQPPDPWS